MKAPTDSHARLRLFCFPYTGGGASACRNWQAGLSSAVEVRALQLPGRENRIAEAPLTSIAQIAGQLACEMLPWLDRPFALFS
jgi:surfactin synthase thioesterase subunit